MNSVALNETSVTMDITQNFIQHAPKVSNTASCKDTIRVMFSYPESPCIVVCDKRNVPVGLVMSDKFYLTMCSRSGMDHYYNAPISKLMNCNPITIDIHDSLHQIALSANQRPIGMRNDSIIITSNNQYVGVVRPSDIQHLL